MTDIEQKALALAEAWEPRFVTPWTQGRKDALVEIFTEHLRAIEQHEAFRRDVSDHMSDVVNKSRSGKYYTADALGEDLRRFILPKPVDPLVEAIKDCELATLDAIEDHVAEKLRAAMKARGLKIVEIDQ